MLWLKPLELGVIITNEFLVLGIISCKGESMQPKKDNYAVSADNARLLFLKEDQEKLIRKFSLRADYRYLYVRFLDMTYRIERKSGLIQRSVDCLSYTEDSSHQAALSIFDYLCWSREGRKLSNQWVSLQNLGYSFHTGSIEGGGWFSGWAERFSGRTGELEEALKRLGGQKMPSADVSSVLWLFDELPVYLQFWDGDDEFPPRLFFLWDSNTIQYIHYETAFYLIELLMRRIAELSDGKK